jgi:hypothetical protein
MISCIIKEHNSIVEGVFAEKAPFVLYVSFIKVSTLNLLTILDYTKEY